MPRQDINKTTYTVKDLGDQYDGEYLLRFEITTMDSQGPRSVITVLWVDLVELHNEMFLAFRKEDEKPVAYFPLDAQWFMLHKDAIEVLTYAELYDHERSNIKTRTAANARLYQAAKDAAEEQAAQPELPETPKGDQWDKFLDDLYGSGDGTI